MKVTEAILRAISPTAPKSVSAFVPHLNEVMEHYQINTVRRAAMFLAQIAHESMGFSRTKEMASGTAYEGRQDLGNVIPGDGVKYKGRGLIQITGRKNYAALSKEWGIDLLKNPSLLETPLYAVKSAGWYWQQIKGNALADLPDTWRSNTKGYSPSQYICYRVNGGLLGYASRMEYYERALKALKDAA